MNVSHDASSEGPFEPLEPIDLLLGQGSDAERATLQARLDADPVTALAMAEVVALVERCRAVRVEPSLRLHGRLRAVVAQAERRLPVRESSRWPHLWLGLAAGVLTGVALFAIDPLRRSSGITEWVCEASPVAVPVVEAESGGAPFELAVERMRARLGDAERSPQRAEFEAALRTGGDGLSRWVDPRNAMAWLRIDYELGANAARRWEALARHGVLPAADVRVQQLADGLAEQLPAWLVATPRTETVHAVAGAVRALVAAGAAPQREPALQAAGDWLLAQAGEATGTSQVVVLAALLDVIAVRDLDAASVRAAGQRLVDGVLRYDTETWERRLPELIGGHVDAHVLGELGRMLQRLPAVGIDGARCELVRRLCLGQLRVRQSAGQVQPELTAAMLYGFADLLPAEERSAREQELLRWKPVRLLPDFATVAQHVWAILPGRRGFARLQVEVRQLAVCPTPATFEDRALLCLCLAKDYATRASEADLHGL